MPADLKLSEFAEDPELHRRLTSLSQRAARYLGLSRLAAEDISQAVMLALLRIPKEKLDEVENLDAYIYRIARNEAISLARKADKHEEGVDAFSSVYSDGSGGADYVERRILLNEIWTELNEDDREILQLLIFGYGAKEIAARLETTHDTARQRISRLRKRLRELVFGTVEE